MSQGGLRTFTRENTRLLQGPKVITGTCLLSLTEPQLIGDYQLTQVTGLWQYTRRMEILPTSQHPRCSDNSQQVVGQTSVDRSLIGMKGLLFSSGLALPSYLVHMFTWNRLIAKPCIVLSKSLLKQFSTIMA